MRGFLSFSVVKNPYRFTQLGAGWVLRDVSIHNKEIVIDFLNKHKGDMIKEAVRYATEKMSPSDKIKVEDSVWRGYYVYLTSGIRRITYPKGKEENGKRGL